jgi:hypothetical protein
LPELDPSETQLAPADGQETVPPQRFPIRSVFVGADGLRAVWSLLLFFALFLAALFVGNSLTPIFRDLIRSLPSATSMQSGMSPAGVFLNEGIPLISVALATWAMAKIERRPVSAYGFPARRGARNFCAGLAWGLALLSLLIALLRFLGFLVFDARLLSSNRLALFAAIWFANFLLVALLEEAMSRGYLQFTLTRGLGGLYRWLFGPAHANALGFWTAALALSFVFGFDHGTNPGESPLGLLDAGLVGLLWCLSLWRTGSLWWAIGFHASWDWAESFLYGVPDSGLMVKGHLFATHSLGHPYLSGGLTGPEGSLLLLPVLACGVAVVLLTLPRTNFGYLPANAPTSPTALDFS